MGDPPSATAAVALAASSIVENAKAREAFNALRVGDTVRVVKDMELVSGNKVAIGSTGVVTEVPGDLPNSVEVKINDHLFDAECFFIELHEPDNPLTEQQWKKPQAPTELRSGKQQPVGMPTKIPPLGKQKKKNSGWMCCFTGAGMLEDSPKKSASSGSSDVRRNIRLQDTLPPERMLSSADPAASESLGLSPEENETDSMEAPAPTPADAFLPPRQLTPQSSRRGYPPNFPHAPVSPKGRPAKSPTNSRVGTPRGGLPRMASFPHSPGVPTLSRAPSMAMSEGAVSPPKSRPPSPSASVGRSPSGWGRKSPPPSPHSPVPAYRSGIIQTRITPAGRSSSQRARGRSQSSAPSPFPAVKSPRHARSLSPVSGAGLSPLSRRVSLNGWSNLSRKGSYIQSAMPSVKTPISRPQSPVFPSVKTPSSRPATPPLVKTPVHVPFTQVRTPSPADLRLPQASVQRKPSGPFLTKLKQASRLYQVMLQGKPELTVQNAILSCDRGAVQEELANVGVIKHARADPQRDVAAFVKVIESIPQDDGAIDRGVVTWSDVAQAVDICRGIDDARDSSSSMITPRGRSAASSVHSDKVFISDTTPNIRQQPLSMTPEPSREVPHPVSTAEMALQTSVSLLPLPEPVPVPVSVPVSVQTPVSLAPPPPQPVPEPIVRETTPPLSPPSPAAAFDVQPVDFNIRSVSEDARGISLFATVQKMPGEELGLDITDDMVVESISHNGAADRSNVAEHVIGMRLVKVNGTPVYNPREAIYYTMQSVVHLEFHLPQPPSLPTYSPPENRQQSPPAWMGDIRSTPRFKVDEEGHIVSVKPKPKNVGYMTTGGVRWKSTAEGTDFRWTDGLRGPTKRARGRTRTPVTQLRASTSEAVHRLYPRTISMRMAADLERQKRNDVKRYQNLRKSVTPPARIPASLSPAESQLNGTIAQQHPLPKSAKTATTATTTTTTITEISDSTSSEPSRRNVQNESKFSISRTTITEGQEKSTSSKDKVDIKRRSNVSIRTDDDDDSLTILGEASRSGQTYLTANRSAHSIMRRSKVSGLSVKTDDEDDDESLTIVEATKSAATLGVSSESLQPVSVHTHTQNNLGVSKTFGQTSSSISNIIEIFEDRERAASEEAERERAEQAKLEQGKAERKRGPSLERTEPVERVGVKGTRTPSLSPQLLSSSQVSHEKGDAPSVETWLKRSSVEGTPRAADSPASG